MWPYQEEGIKCTGPPPTIHLQDSEVKVQFQGGLPTVPGKVWLHTALNLLEGRQH